MSLFSISTVILCLSGLVFSFIIYRTDEKNKISKAWFYSCVTFSLWALGLTGVTISSNPKIAYGWQCLLDVSAIFLPYLYLLFVLRLTNSREELTKKILFVCVIVFSLFSFSPLFKIGMTTRYDFQWVNPGPYYFLFLVYFIFYALLTLGLLFRSYFNAEKKTILRSQIRNTILGGIIGYGGGITNFFPQLFSIYPYGNYLVILYIVFMMYGVIKFKLISRKVISAQVFSAALILVSLFNLLKSEISFDWLLNLLILILVGIFSVLLINSVNREVEERKKNEHLASDLKTINAHLTELNRQKSEFVSFATHQLRAPLTAMKGYASLLLEGDMGKLENESKEGVMRIYEAANTLTTIVDDYLNITRIELGSMKYAFDTIDLRLLVEDVLGELKPSIEKSKLQFTFDTEDIGTTYRITADKDKLKQVISNIIDNSLKYTPSGFVKVNIRFDRTIHKFVLIVEDSGIGIDPQIIPRLFQKFSRADNANTTNIKGTGLGLYVAKEIITAHGGTIHVESEGEGKGSRFIIEFEPLVKV